MMDKLVSNADFEVFLFIDKLVLFKNWEPVSYLPLTETELSNPNKIQYAAVQLLNNHRGISLRTTQESA